MENCKDINKSFVFIKCINEYYVIQCNDFSSLIKIKEYGIFMDNRILFLEKQTEVTISY